MRGYKIVARILLILSVINFTLTAPVVVREHKVRVIESNDGPGSSNPAPPIDSPSPLPGPAQSPSHSLSAGPSSPQDVYTSPVPTSQAPTDEPHPSPLAHGSQESNPSSPLVSPTDRNNLLDVNSAPPSSLRFGSLSNLVSTQGDSHHPGSPQIASSDSWQIMSSSDEPHPSSSWEPKDSDSSSTSSGSDSTSKSSLRFGSLSNLGSTQGASHPPGSPQIASSDSWQIMSSSDEPHPSSSWEPNDSDSSSTNSGSRASQDHASLAPTLWSSPGQVRPPPNLPWSWSQPTRTRVPPDLPWLWSSRTRTRTGVPPPQSPGGHLPTEEPHPSSWDQLLATVQSHLSQPDQVATGEPHPPTLSTDDGPSPIPGPTDNRPQLASPSDPAPSTDPNPPPSTEPLRPGEHESWSLLSKISKGKFKRHFSGYGSLNAE